MYLLLLIFFAANYIDAKVVVYIDNIYEWTNTLEMIDYF